LQQARDILVQRLTDRILDMREELLDDAHGRTYCGEIDALYEQIALRLNHVNVMLSSLPAPAEPPPAAPALTTLPALPGPSLEIGGRLESSLFQADTGQSSGRDTMASAHEAMALTSPVTFELFARQIAGDDLDSASRSLAVLFAVEPLVARRCAGTFHQRYRRRSETLQQALQLHRELQTGNINGSLLLLRDCFGLEGKDLIGVMQTLQARLLGMNEAS
jgi:hypothetical protein